MNEKLRNHPLNGIGLEELLGDLLRQYGWEVLAKQVPVDCFRRYPSFKSSVTFLRKTEWARERLEDLYLYKFLQYPLPENEQQHLPPRNRVIESQRKSDEPANMTLDDSEFLATPERVSAKLSRSGVSRRRPSDESKNKSDQTTKASQHSGGSPDPWAKWR